MTTRTTPLPARLVTLLLVALLALTVGSLPASAARTQTGAAASGDLSAAVQAEQQKVAAHQATESTLQGNVDAHNEKVAAHNEAVADLDQQASAHTQKVTALADRIAAHNARPHQFQLLQQAGELAAYDGEAAELNTEKEGLDAEGAQLGGRQAQLDGEGSQLDSEEQQQRSQADAYNREGAQLTAECRELLMRIAEALQKADVRPAPDPAPGGDRARPSSPLTRPRQVAGDGGDPVSHARENDALDDYGKANGVEVIKEPVWSRLTTEAVGKIPDSATARFNVSRTFDGVVPLPGGRYRALVVPSSSSEPTPGEKAFDDAVKAGGPVIGMLNGKPIIIDELESVPGRPVAKPVVTCAEGCQLVSDGTASTATVSPQKLLDDAKALHDTVPGRRDAYVTVATAQLGGSLVYAVNRNGTNEAMRALADQLGYRRVYGLLDQDIHTDAEQILYNAIEEGDESDDGIIASSRPACGPDPRVTGKPGQDCAGRALSFPNLQLWERQRNR